MMMNDNTMTTTSFANTQTRPWLPWLVCFIASLFFFYEFIQMNMFNAISNPLMQAFQLNATELGHLAAIYFYATVIFLLPAGTILDRISTRRVILIALGLCVLGTFFFAMAQSVLVIAICRFFTGIGSAFCFLSCIRIASRWFPAQRMALVAGLVVTMAMIGGMVAQTPLTLLVAKFGWRQALIIDAGLGIIVWVLIFLLVRDYPAQQREQHILNQQQLKQIGYWQSMKMTYSRGQNWLCGIYTSLLNLPIFILGGFMGNLYLVSTHALTSVQASYITSMLFMGTIVGSPIMGWFSDRVGRRRLPMILGAITSLVVIFAIMFLPNLQFTSLLLLFLALGFFTSTQVISYPTVAESNSRLLTATAVSVVSLSCLSGGAIFDPVFGWLLDFHANSQGNIGQIGHYTAADFQFAIWLLPIVFIAGLLAALSLRETFCQEKSAEN